MAAAVIGMYFSIRVEEVAKLGDAGKLFAFKDTAWRSIFWVSLPPGILFVIGSLMVSESPRWLFRRGQHGGRPRRAAPLPHAQSRRNSSCRRWRRCRRRKSQDLAGGRAVKESLLHRHYVIPFVLACVILACNQATGVNSIIGYNATILIQAGLNDVQAHWGYVILTTVNFLMTMVGVMLVDRKGRKFLLSLGSAGIIVSLICVGALFHQTEKQRVDCAAAVQAMVTPEQTVTIGFNDELAAKLLATSGKTAATGKVAIRPR